MFPNDLTFEFLPIPALRWPSPSVTQPMPQPTANRAFERSYDITAVLECCDCTDGSYTLRLPARGGDQRMCQVHLQTLPDHARLGIIEDMQLYHQDLLTGLDDRRALRLDALGLDCMGLALLDIDGFKGINDTLGHAAGDQVLSALAELLRASAKTWGVRAYRLGGDEFVMMGDFQKTGPFHPEGLIPLQSRFRRLMTRCGMDVQGFSFGIAVAPRDGHSVCELLEQADMRLMDHKVSRRGAMAAQLVRHLKQHAVSSPTSSPVQAGHPARRELSPWLPALLPWMTCDMNRAGFHLPESRSAEKV